MARRTRPLDFASAKKTVGHPLIISIRLSRLKPTGFRVTNQVEL
jgi:hypothetical protein